MAMQRKLFLALAVGLAVVPLLAVGALWLILTGGRRAMPRVVNRRGLWCVLWRENGRVRRVSCGRGPQGFAEAERTAENLGG
jgi:hypothetical protein